jgi:hypothetical protein
MLFPEFCTPWCFVAKVVSLAIFLPTFTLWYNFIFPQWLCLYFGAHYYFDVIDLIDIRTSVKWRDEHI